MNKKILVSLSVIGAVAAIAVGGTIAYFSDVETSTGNTFTAGSLDLKVDSQCHYYQDNGGGYVDVGCTDVTGAPFGEWTETDLGLNYKFFNFADVKPGDKGENTISLHPVDNDAYICAYVTNLTNNDNGITEPESYVDSSDGVGNGELQNNIHLMIWSDTGVELDGKITGTCDNKLQQGETVLVDDTVINTNYGGWLLGKIAGDKTTCLGVAWSVPTDVGNIIQSDSVSADISFYAEQVRNNPNFQCPSQLPVESILVVSKNVMNFSSTGWGGLSCPSDHPNPVSGGVSQTNVQSWVAPDFSVSFVLAVPGATLDGFTYPVFPHYTYPAGENGIAIHNGGTAQSLYAYLYCAK